MMLAMFLQSSGKKEEGLLEGFQSLPLSALSAVGSRADLGAAGSRGPPSLRQDLQLQVGMGAARPAGSSILMLHSPIIHAGNWPVCPSPTPAVMYGRRRSKKKAE